MRGLWIEDGAWALRDDLPEPRPAEGESLVEVLAAGVCATDLALARGYMGFTGVPGHEFVGRALDGPLRGRRVVGGINAGCGRCERCRAGDARHCAARTVLGILGRGGAFAERLVLPHENLLAVPDDVSDEAATLTEPLAAALAILDAVEVSPGLRCLVAGDGRLGLLCAHALATAGARPVVAGRHPERAALLPEGATHVTGWLEEHPTTRPEPRFDLAVEATGDAAVLARLRGWVVPRGTLVLKTTTEEPATLDLAGLVVDEQRLVGSRCGRMEPALALLATGRLPVAGLIAARYPLARADKALSHAARPGVLKVLVDVAGAGA